MTRENYQLLQEKLETGCWLSLSEIGGSHKEACAQFNIIWSFQVHEPFERSWRPFDAVSGV
jgi:uncharacterized protein YeaC (DUF1315 family)